MRGKAWIAATLLAPGLSLAQIDGANMVDDVQRGYAIAKPCDDRLSESPDSYQQCMSTQAGRLPGRARVQRQAFYFYGWLKADAVPAPTEQSEALRQHFAAQLSKERGKSELPLKLMCRVARADCAGVEGRLGLKR